MRAVCRSFQKMSSNTLHNFCDEIASRSQERIYIYLLSLRGWKFLTPQTTSLSLCRKTEPESSHPSGRIIRLARCLPLHVVGRRSSLGSHPISALRTLRQMASRSGDNQSASTFSRPRLNRQWLQPGSARENLRTDGDKPIRRRRNLETFDLDYTRRSNYRTEGIAD